MNEKEVSEFKWNDLERIIIIISIGLHGDSLR